MHYPNWSPFPFEQDLAFRHPYTKPRRLTRRVYCRIDPLDVRAKRSSDLDALSISSHYRDVVSASPLQCRPFGRLTQDCFVLRDDHPSASGDFWDPDVVLGSVIEVVIHELDVEPCFANGLGYGATPETSIDEVDQTRQLWRAFRIGAPLQQLPWKSRNLRPCP